MVSLFILYTIYVVYYVCMYRGGSRMTSAFLQFDQVRSKQFASNLRLTGITPPQPRSRKSRTSSLQSVIQYSRETMRLVPTRTPVRNRLFSDDTPCSSQSALIGLRGGVETGVEYKMVYLRAFSSPDPTP